MTVRALDIFCGGGGSSWGARSAGVELVGAIDACVLATQTYAANFPHTRVITGRLESLKGATLKSQIGRIDLLLASPECTNHTCAKGSAPRDEASRATAMLVVDYARLFRPRWLVLENVVHMRPWSRYGELRTSLEGLGYQIAEQVLDASHHGVAQTRRRLFLTGDLKRPPQLVTHRRPGRRRSARSILDTAGTWPVQPLRTIRRAEATLERASRGFDAVGVDSDFLLVYYGTDGGGGWQPLERPLRTVTTVDRFALIQAHDDGHSIRMLQVPEIRRAMGFGDEFILPVGSRRDKIRILGNSVCPPVMNAVVKALVSE